jgi:hypothetical protein
MVEAACSLERGDADFILLCTNTMHKLAPQIEAAVRILPAHCRRHVRRRRPGITRLVCSARATPWKRNL